jgi:hypothetical protein
MKEQVAELAGKLAVLSERLQQEGQRIPNMTHPSVPIGSEDVASIRKEVTLSISRIFNVSVCSNRSVWFRDDITNKSCFCLTVGWSTERCWRSFFYSCMDSNLYPVSACGAWYVSTQNRFMGTRRGFVTAIQLFMYNWWSSQFVYGQYQPDKKSCPIQLDAWAS